jgi:hypothetical protein
MAAFHCIPRLNAVRSLSPLLNAACCLRPTTAATSLSACCLSGSFTVLPTFFCLHRLFRVHRYVGLFAFRLTFISLPVVALYLFAALHAAAFIAVRPRVAVDARKKKDHTARQLYDAFATTTTVMQRMPLRARTGSWHTVHYAGITRLLLAARLNNNAAQRFRWASTVV